MLLPQIEHDTAMRIARGVPVVRIAVEPIGQLLPHERGVMTRGLGSGRSASGRPPT